MRITLDPSYILHARHYRESSLLLEAYSRNHGRVGIVARGARGSRSRWKNVLQPFRPLLLSWNQRGELGTLTEADQVASPPALAGPALFSAGIDWRTLARVPCGGTSERAPERRSSISSSKYEVLTLFT